MSSPDKNRPSSSPHPGPQAQEQAVVKFAKDPNPDAAVMPSLFGGGYGTYQVRPENFLLSFVTHTAAIGLILWLLHVTVTPKVIAPIKLDSIELAPYLGNIGKAGPSGGGGGDASKIKASTGTPPKAAKQQFAPPVVLQPQQSKLMVQPTVVADLKIPTSNQLGDPLSKLMTPSNGTGIGGGIGSGDGGGVGSGHGGPGVGPGVYSVGGGVSAPRVLYQPEPEFSEEARKAKYQGVVGLNVIVGADGRIHQAQVVRSLGMGLDEKAIEGVKLWKFEPAKKDGRPVAVAVYVEVDFHLY
jgi:TonB family protein